MNKILDSCKYLICMNYFKKKQLLCPALHIASDGNVNCENCITVWYSKNVKGL